MRQLGSTIISVVTFSSASKSGLSGRTFFSLSANNERPPVVHATGAAPVVPTPSLCGILYDAKSERAGIGQGRVPAFHNRSTSHDKRDFPDVSMRRQPSLRPLRRQRRLGNAVSKIVEIVILKLNRRASETRRRAWHSRVGTREARADSGPAPSPGVATTGSEPGQPVHGPGRSTPG
jgi:hypothetical protein